MIAWAVERMQEGFEGENTVLLASADYDDDDVLFGHFIGAAQEAGTELPEKDASVWLESYICTKVVTAELNAYEGLIHLYDLWRNAGKGQKFGNWQQLGDSVDIAADGFKGIPPFEHTLVENAHEVIKGEAARVLQEKSQEQI